MICPNCGVDNLMGVNECRHCHSDLSGLVWSDPRDRIESSLLRDTVGQLNPRSPVTVPLHASVAEALHVLLEADVGAVLVVDDAGLLAGIFSERDLLNKVADLNRPLVELPVEQFMTPRPQTISDDDTLAFALHKMDVGGYRHLPVVRDGRPMGMLSVRDLIRHMTRLCRSS